jgi:single-strand DNA-binding protein
MAKFEVIGNLGGDVEITYTDGGMAIAKFSVAENFRKKVNGEWVDDHTTWWRCAAFKDVAEKMVGWGRGDRVHIVDATVDERAWTDKEGNERKTTEISVNKVYLV